VQRQIISGLETYTITSMDGSSSAMFIPGRGGILASLVLPGKQGARELLFQHDYFADKELPDLPGGMPFLFPICGRLQRLDQENMYQYDGQIFSMEKHGFAWREAWSVSSLTDETLTLELKDNERTKKMYPFSFRVELIYQIHRSCLICQHRIYNTDSKPMPYYAGFHPYYLTPEPGKGKDELTVDFDSVRRMVLNESLTDVVCEDSAVSTPLKITDPAINEQLFQVYSKETILRFQNGEALHMIAEGTDDPQLYSYLQLYTREDKPYFCAEPWMSFPNAMNSVQGTRWIQPGGSDHGMLTIKLI